MVDPCKEDCYHPQSHHYPPPGESSSGDSSPTLSKVISATGQTGSPCGPAWSTTPWAYFNRSRCLYVHGHFALRISAETVTLVVTLLAYCYPLHADGIVLTLHLCEQNLGVSHRRHYPSFDAGRRAHPGSGSATQHLALAQIESGVEGDTSFKGLARSALWTKILIGGYGLSRRPPEAPAPIGRLAAARSRCSGSH
jgi:hypothetical protein